MFIFGRVFIRVYTGGRHIRIREVGFIGGMFLVKLNRIYHRIPMQIEKSQPEGKRIMP